jgi:hypothetical protein
MLKQKKVYLAILNQNTVATELVKALTLIIQEDANRIVISYSAIKPITHNRNTITQKFLASDCDYLMMIDDDIIPPLNIMRLVDFDKDIMSPLMFTRRQGELYPLYLKRKPDGVYDVADYFNDTGLQECDATGTGCIIIKRKVLETVKHPFENRYDRDGIKTFGQDFNFCEKAKASGFKVWVHLDYVCDHLVDYNLKDLYYLTVKYERQKRELETLKEYLTENNIKILNKAEKAIEDKQLIRPKL